jgi:hypothetical protein
MAPPRKKRIVRSHKRGDKIPYKVNVETRIGRIFRQRKPATSFVAPHFRRAQASAFMRICAATNLLELKYFNFQANFA